MIHLSNVGIKISDILLYNTGCHSAFTLHADLLKILASKPKFCQYRYHQNGCFYTDTDTDINIGGSLD